MDKKTITVDYYSKHGDRYDWTHSIKSEWEKQDEINFCPNCGVQGHIWEELGEGDYYQGPEYICSNCGVSFTAPTYHVITRAKCCPDTQTLDALRSE